MNKKEQISFFKNQLSSADIRISLARQIIAEATQSKVEATRALEMLGNTPERTRKGETELSDSVKVRLMGDLTKKKSA
jgi:hypothetical protein